MILYMSLVWEYEGEPSSVIYFFFLSHIWPLTNYTAGVLLEATQTGPTEFDPFFSTWSVLLDFDFKLICVMLSFGCLVFLLPVVFLSTDLLLTLRLLRTSLQYLLQVPKKSSASNFSLIRQQRHMALFAETTSNTCQTINLWLDWSKVGWVHEE